ncbi:hypothetical protein BUALT_Bualt09G0032600 [Buddleja alternifolia]|uniref:Uncharacterized protein n=1 Tax=Buddleja alternifolia TaxID=168488 RepID=A0AAV6X0Z5_9LAMI|nr:hypothetical protein BUALT_Bualt09G0032600 [Buddleja alternifolia]
MSRYPEISSLFASLASNLRTLDPTAGDEVDLSISNLNRSLNLSEAPRRVRVLDTALSLMCFTAPQVYDSVTEFTVKTIVTVLSASIDCKMLTINKEQVLRVGGSIYKSDCANVMDACADILRKLQGRQGNLCALLLYTVIRMAAFAPCSPSAMPSTSNLDVKFSDASTSALTNLLGHLPNEFKFNNEEIPLRLLLWHLNPIILKQDILQILQEIIKRPFLSLSMEIYDRIELRSKMICLVISPSTFIETRALLHNWFLMTGLASVMELQIEFVCQVLDIISRPMWWGISIEVGSKLPFSHAYFPHEHHLFRILAGPISQDNFQHLLNKISGSVSPAGDHLHKSSKKAATKMNIVDHKSVWSMVMNFPNWFFFASMLLFSSNCCADSSYSGTICGPVKPCLMHDMEVSCSEGAAKFIAWILNPISNSYQCLTVDCLIKASELWALKFFNARKLLDNEGVPRIHMKETRGLDSWTIWLWLKEFNDMYIKFVDKNVGISNSNSKGFDVHQNLFLRRIPLGILLEYSNHLNPAGCALLLHFAATGTIQKFLEPQKSGHSQKRWKHDWQGDSVAWVEEYTRAEAVAGCKIAFDITDIAENVSPSVFETEEEGLKFVCQMKLKSSNYLLKCIKRLLQLNLERDGPHMQTDLLSRVMRWRSLGKDVFENNKDFDCVCDALNV